MIELPPDKDSPYANPQTGRGHTHVWDKGVISVKQGTDLSTGELATFKVRTHACATCGEETIRIITYLTRRPAPSLLDALTPPHGYGGTGTGKGDQR